MALTKEFADARIAQVTGNYNSGDFDANLQFYSSDGCVMPAGVPSVPNKEVANFFRGLSGSTGLTRLKYGSDDLIAGPGDHAIEKGWYIFSTSDGSKEVKGKYLFVWKKEGGQWKYHYLSFGPDQA